MIRRQQQDDGSVVIWSQQQVFLYGPRGALLESRDLTDTERAVFEAWCATQPGGDSFLAALAAAQEAQEAQAAADAELEAARTIPQLVAALRRARS